VGYVVGSGCECGRATGADVHWLLYEEPTMSNNIDGNPYILDTASSSLVTARRLRIQSIRWVSGSASAGDAVSVQSALGQVIWSSVATGINYVEAENWPYEAPLVADGLKVPTLGSGTLYISLFP